MSRWFRHYAGMARDEKLVSAAVRSKQSVERVVWIWGAILESAAEINDGGRYDFDAAEAAYFLRADEADIHAVVDGLADMQRLADNRVVNWSTRQFESDKSAPRQATYRARKRAQLCGTDDKQDGGDDEVTAQDRHVTPVSQPSDAPIDREQILETERKKERTDIRAVADATRPDDGDFEKFWKVFPKRAGANPKTPARKKFEVARKSGAPPGDIVGGANRYADEQRKLGKIGTEHVAQAVTWLNQRRWTDYPATAPPETEKPVYLTPPEGMPTIEEIRAKYGKTNAAEVRTEIRSNPGLGEGGGDIPPKLQLSG